MGEENEIDRGKKKKETEGGRKEGRGGKC